MSWLWRLPMFLIAVVLLLVFVIVMYPGIYYLACTEEAKWQKMEKNRKAQNKRTSG